MLETEHIENENTLDYAATCGARHSHVLINKVTSKSSKFLNNKFLHKTTQGERVSGTNRVVLLSFPCVRFCSERVSDDRFWISR
jgi:hypothetical protein